MLSIPRTRFFVRHFGKRSITSSHNPKVPKPLVRPVRGGQNLSQRFKRLENSLRGKDTIKRELTAKSGSQSHPTLRVVTLATACPSTQTHIFHGFHVPQEPKPPADDECCMSGCAVCIYDLYEESLAAYKDEVDALRKALTAMKLPEAEWPAHIQVQKPNAVASTEAQRKEKILSAFEEMERGLAMKKQRQMETDRNLLFRARQERRNRLVHLKASRSLVSELHQFIRWVLFSSR